VTFADNDGASGDNRVAFDDILSNPGHLGVNATTPVKGKLNATLPIFFPTDADFLGKLGLQIDDIAAFLTSGDTSLVHIQVPDLSNIVSNFHFNRWTTCRY